MYAKKDITGGRGSGLFLTARLDYVDNKILVTDLNSTNGTFLDGTALIPHIAQALHNQAALQLGQLLLRVEFG